MKKPGKSRDFPTLPNLYSYFSRGWPYFSTWTPHLYQQMLGLLVGFILTECRPVGKLGDRNRELTVFVLNQPLQLQAKVEVEVFRLVTDVRRPHADEAHALDAVMLESTGPIL